METLDDEPDDEMVVVSFNRRGSVEQFILFREVGLEYVYPEYPKIYNNPETTDGGW